MFDGQQFTIGGGYDISGTLMVIKHRHLTHAFAYAKQGERLGVVRVELGAQSAGQNDVDVVILQPGGEQCLFCREPDPSSIRKQGGERAVFHLLE